MRVLEALVPDVLRDDDGDFLGFDYKANPLYVYPQISDDDYDNEWFVQNNLSAYSIYSSRRECLIKYIEGVIDNITKIKPNGSCMWQTSLEDYDDTARGTYYTRISSASSGALRNATTTYDVNAKGVAYTGDGLSVVRLGITIIKQLLSDYIKYTLIINEMIMGSPHGVTDGDDVEMWGNRTRLNIVVDTRPNGDKNVNLVRDGVKESSQMYNDFQTIDD